jgi:hypothetical protein
MFYYSKACGRHHDIAGSTEGRLRKGRSLVAHGCRPLLNLSICKFVFPKRHCTKTSSITNNCACLTLHALIRLSNDEFTLRCDHNTWANWTIPSCFNGLQEAPRYPCGSLQSRFTIPFLVLIGGTVLNPVT